MAEYSMDKLDNFHISCASSYFKQEATYIGLTIFEMDGQKQWFLNGRKCKSGYTAMLDINTLLGMEGAGNFGGDLHRLAFYYMFGGDVIPDNVVGDAFRIVDGACLFDTGVFVPIETQGETREVLVKVLAAWMDAGVKSGILPKQRNYPVCV